MKEDPRDRKDFFQNIAIALLSLSAAVLMLQPQLSSLWDSTAGSSLSQFLTPPASSGAAVGAQSTVLSAPVRIAVTGTYGRYGNVSLVTSDESFLPLGSLLGEALGSAKAYAPCTQQDFLDALAHTSVYYDFLSPLPLPILADQIGAGAKSFLQARCLILSKTAESGLSLYLWDGSDNYQVSSTAVSTSDLDAVINRYELGNAVFAFDQAESDNDFTNVAPCSLFLPDALPEFPALHGGNPLTETDSLLTSLKFNPRTNYRYPESDGTEVVVEGDRSLRIGPDGTVLYRSGGESALTLESANSDAPTVLEIAHGATALVSALLENTGDAEPYLQSFVQNGASAVLRFGYQVNGVPIRFSDGSCAAELTVDGAAVSSLSLRFRQYTLSGGTASPLLPLRQALAISSDEEGAELSVGYADGGGSTLNICWLSD
ncbi:hypothetical protein [Oscillibacter sp.]|uniref:hypothetical protein n=1 Tax=Oscillibacter sp. TaxID=1945593 RepID=UPI0026343C3D|nr:hypothetical protein [Oscillibacter sp.]MDD3346938.1 hypothetical protein [Oscillibacter sp.]